MFSTKGQKVNERVEKSLQPGVVYAHLFDAKVKTSKNGKKMLEIILEGPPLENFEGWSVIYGDENGPKFKGQSAKVGATIYTESFKNSNPMKNQQKFRIILLLMRMFSQKNRAPKCKTKNHLSAYFFMICVRTH